MSTADDTLTGRTPARVLTAMRARLPGVRVRLVVTQLPSGDWRAALRARSFYACAIQASEEGALHELATALGFA